MCGIFAIFGKEDEPYVSNAANIIKGRGPDSTVISKDINNGWSKLVFTRLAIVDTSVNGDQPFIDGNISLMCNGEIYNHRTGWRGQLSIFAENRLNINLEINCFQKT